MYCNETGSFPRPKKRNQKAKKVRRGACTLGKRLPPECEREYGHFNDRVIAITSLTTSNKGLHVPAETESYPGTFEVTVQCAIYEFWTTVAPT